MCIYYFFIYWDVYIGGYSLDVHLVEKKEGKHCQVCKSEFSSRLLSTLLFVQPSWRLQAECK